jgi:hypothetical protein
MTCTDKGVIKVSNLVIRRKRRLNRYVFGRQYGIKQHPQRCYWSSWLSYQAKEVRNWRVSVCDSCWLELVKASDPDCVFEVGRIFGNANVHAPITHFRIIKKGGIAGARAHVPGDT